jgi:hypothetical protein
MNNKGVSRTVMLFSIVLFFVFSTFLYGIIGQGLLAYGNTEATNWLINTDNQEAQIEVCKANNPIGTTTDIDCLLQIVNGKNFTTTSTYATSDVDSKTGIISWWKGLTVATVLFPWWVTFLFITPLIAMLTFLIITAFFPTTNAGE